LWSRGLHLLSYTPHLGLRNGIIVQTRNVPELEREIDHRFPVGRKEGAAFCRMLIYTHGYMESFLNRCYCALQLHVPAFTRAFHYLETIGLRELNQRIVVLLARTKSCRELLRRDEVAIVGAGWIVDIL